MHISPVKKKGGILQIENNENLEYSPIITSDHSLPCSRLMARLSGKWDGISVD
jgi:hypothetical protein